MSLFFYRRRFINYSASPFISPTKPNPLQLLSLAIFNKNIEVVCKHPLVYEILRSNFNEFTATENNPSDTVDLSYQVDFDEIANIYSLEIEPDTVLKTSLLGEFLLWIEKEITITLTFKAVNDIIG